MDTYRMDTSATERYHPDACLLCMDPDGSGNPDEEEQDTRQCDRCCDVFCGDHVSLHACTSGDVALCDECSEGQIATCAVEGCEVRNCTDCISGWSFCGKCEETFCQMCVAAGYSTQCACPEEEEEEDSEEED
jgi:hypothetical protein